MLGRQASLYEDELTVYSCLKVVDTGQWLDVLFTVTNGPFNVPEISHRTDVADALGLTPGELAVVDADSDLRSGSLLAVPAPPAVPPDPALVRMQELLAIPRSNWTVAQRTELLELVAREITG